MPTQFKKFYGFSIFIFLALAFYIFSSKHEAPSPSDVKPSMVTTAESPASTLPVSTMATAERAHDSLPVEAIQENSNSVTAENKEVQKARGLAKAYLAALYAAQASYYAEYNRYTTDLKALGWSPIAAKINFKMGFLSGIRPEQYNDWDEEREDPRRMDTDSFMNQKLRGSEESYVYDEKVRGLNLQNYSFLCRQNCSATEDSFEALLAIPLQDEQHVDIWSINDKKEIVLVQDGMLN